MTIEAEHIMIQDSPKNTALTVMENNGALFNVTYPPARFWQEGELGWVDEYPMPLVDKGKHKDTCQYKWVVREDTGQVLGMHSGTYPENPNYEYLGDLAERMFPESTTGCTVIDGGERIMLKQDIGETIDLGGGDTIKPQVLWISSFNGTWATQVLDSISRWFCSNQIITGDALFKVKHTLNHNYTLEARAWVLEESMKRSKTFGAMARILKDQAFTDEQFKELTKQLVPDPQPLPGEKEVALRRWTSCHKKRDHMVTTWQSECEQWDVKNRWLAYNAIQGTEQHHINTGYSDTDDGIAKATVKLVNGRTPLATKAMTLLTSSSV